jgi:predicted TIM-barrel fold metal-dependent hydrolase
MQVMAIHPHVSVKISGFGMFDPAWTTDSIRPLVRETITIFGVDRCMFASNFPVDRVWSTYARLLEAFASITAGLSATERRKLFHDNAARIYRL